jgi:hypothetical protein
MISALLSVGGPAAFATVVSGWLFRTSAAPLWLKITAPAVAVAAACYAPVAVNGLLGYPAVVAERDLPESAELIAFVPHDGDKRVDLWLRLGDEPRAFETALSPQMKKVLGELREAMQRGDRVTLHSERKGDALGIGDDQDLYTLEVESALPAKE